MGDFLFSNFIEVGLHSTRFYILGLQKILLLKKRKCFTDELPDV